jgi:hypothetical protein
MPDTENPMTVLAVHYDGPGAKERCEERAAEMRAENDFVEERFTHWIDRDRWEFAGRLRAAS